MVTIISIIIIMTLGSYLVIKYYKPKTYEGIVVFKYEDELHNYHLVISDGTVLKVPKRVYDSYLINYPIKYDKSTKQIKF